MLQRIFLHYIFSHSFGKKVMKNGMKQVEQNLDFQGVLKNLKSDKFFGIKKVNLHINTKLLFKSWFLFNQFFHYFHSSFLSYFLKFSNVKFLSRVFIFLSHHEQVVAPTNQTDKLNRPIKPTKQRNRQTN